MMSGDTNDEKRPRKPRPQEDLHVLGVNLRRIYPLPDDPDFDDLLRAIDNAQEMQK